jgi:RHS repeat-associated protein
LLAEADSQGNLTKAYGFNPKAAQQGLWSTDPIWQANVTNNNLTSSTTGYHYLHTDHLATPILGTDKAGAITWKGASEAFGATMPTIEGTEMNLRFPGQYWDQETQTHYNYRRDYSVLSGRYLQRDPLGSAGGVNDFIYSDVNPLVKIDPSGLKWTPRDFSRHYFYGRGRTVSLSEIGLLNDFITHPSVKSAMDRVFNLGKNKLISKLKAACDDCDVLDVSATVETREFDEKYDVTGFNPHAGLFNIGDGLLFNKGKCSGFYDCKAKSGGGVCNIPFYMRDAFQDPLDIFDLLDGGYDFGTSYKIQGDWTDVRNFKI